MKRQVSQLSQILLVGFVMGALSIGLSWSQEVDFPQFIQATQKGCFDDDKLMLVWWVPEEYWAISFASDPLVTDAATEEITGVFRPYTMIAVIDGKVGMFGGGTTYRGEADIRANIWIRDSDGVRYSPITRDKISADANDFLLSIKPTFTNIMGSMGENMHFFFFPAKNKAGQRIADPKKEGKFWVDLDDTEFRWRLPLECLVLLKTCPLCGEKLNGAYKFCPWDGTKLTDTQKKEKLP